MSQQIKNNIEKTLVLCTSHLKQKTLKALRKKKAPIRSAKHEYGAIVFVPLGMEDSYYESEENWFLEHGMDEFLDLYRAARQLECTLINFDVDAPENEAFEIFEN